MNTLYNFDGTWWNWSHKDIKFMYSVHVRRTQKWSEISHFTRSTTVTKKNARSRAHFLPLSCQHVYVCVNLIGFSPVLEILDVIISFFLRGTWFVCCIPKLYSYVARKKNEKKRLEILFNEWESLWLLSLKWVWSAVSPVTL